MLTWIQVAVAWLIARTLSISNALETKILDKVFNAVDFTGHATLYLKLHTGDPGEDGTANAAGETTRAPVTFGAAAAGAISNDSAASWTNVSTSETYSHVSVWDAATAGECKWTGALTTPKAVNAQDNFTIPIGDLDVTLD